jgi:penicillin-binding protein 1A
MATRFSGEDINRQVRAFLARAGALLRRQYDAGFRRWLAIGVWIVFALASIVAIDLLAGTPRPDEIRSIANMPRATTVFDVADQPIFTIYQERRIEVPLSEISPHVVQAVIAIEDQRFYRHAGIDLWRIGGAMLANLRSGERAQGGSTITQQLARKSFLTDEKTIRRKLKEMFLAVRIERQFSKDEILEMYLNKIYFGDGYYGIEAAARGYFAKSAKTLGLDEAALLAGIIQAPSAYAPTEHPDRAIARRAVVLRQMVDAGFIGEAELPALQAAKLTLKNGFGNEQFGQYFKNHLTRVLIDQFGWEAVSKGGLRVYSTIDAKMQRAAEEALAEGLNAAEKQRGYRHLKKGDPRAMADGKAPEYLQGALVSLDPGTGEVRALVGGRDFEESQFNRATQAKRQAGSAFKPFVYAAAIDMGYTPATVLTGLDDPMLTPEGAWVPEDEHLESDAMTVRTALRTSSNRAAVQVLRAVGISRAVSYAERLGIEAPPVPSLVLGSGEVTPLAMTAAYGVFASGGTLNEPVFVRRVEDAEGNEIHRHVAAPQRAVSEQTAFLMAQMLSDVVNSGTGYRIRQVGFRPQAAGKTGTTNDYRDAWFVGFTPALVTGVWIGFDQPKSIISNGYAGELAAPIWGRYMREATGNKDTGWLKRPSGIVAVEVCRVTGARPTDGCRHVLTVDRDGETTERSMVGVEYFRRGTEPDELCPVHETPSFLDRMRTWVGAGPDRPAIPESSAIAVGALPPPPPPADDTAKTEPEKKRGFWSKFKSIFTGGDKDDKDEKKDPKGKGAGS